MTGERRADKRFLLHSPVEITGVDESGLQFVEQSRLEDVGDLGCRFSLRNSVQQGAILGVEPLGRDGENFEDEYSRLFIIVWREPQGDRLLVGARCLLEDELTDSGCPANGFHSKVPAK
jgi:hypothetical protein